MSIVILIVFLGFAIAAVKNPFVGLLGLMSAFMVNPGELSPLAATIHVELLIFAAVLVSTLLHQKVVFTGLSRKMAILWFATLLSVPFSFWPSSAFSFSYDFFRILLFNILFVTLVNTKERFRTALIIYVVLTGWVAGGALWSYANGVFDANALRNGFERATGLTTSNGNPNSLGMTLVASLPLVVLLWKETFWAKAIAVSVICMSLVAIVLTGSRTSFACLLLLAVTFAFTKKTGPLYLLGFMLLAVSLWPFVPDQYRERYSAISAIASGKQKDESYESHRLTRLAGWHMFLDNPINGVGAGQFGVANGQKYWPGPGKKLWLNAHNLYIQIIAELGIIGAVAWLVFIMPLVRDCFRLRKLLVSLRKEPPPSLRSFPIGALFCLLALFIGGWTGHNLYRWMWYLLAAMVTALQQISTKETEARQQEHAPLEKPKLYSYA